MYESLYRNLRLWSVISTRVAFSKIEHIEKGIKQDLYIFIDFWQR